jgi:demethylmenaquinone methyltransferase/2-methoxy-6-polyprenyl-1,4-benzoquinol methylase
VAYQWVDCDRSSIVRRYDRIAGLIPYIDRLLFLPPGLRRSAVERLELNPGDRVLEIGCGTGINFSYLRNAVGPGGHVYGVDISPGMLLKAREQCSRHRWTNVDVVKCDAVDYVAPEPLDGVLFSLSYNTMPHHRAVLSRAWEQLRPGGRLVIMDAKLPPGRMGKMVLPFSLWLMKRTMLGNPLIKPWEELADLADHFEMDEFLFSSYYVCRGTKLAKSAQAVDQTDARRVRDKRQTARQTARD